ncbi:MAG: nucleotidyltransferase domain-containing protein [Deltaproteobacteria bacterium]|nr:nucleotidyltransferase domain-containing protein [Deltaproteobacteria bacterium]
MTTAGQFAELIRAVEVAAIGVYGDRLMSLVVFGSVGRGTARPDSDLDLLLVADPLPRGRMARVAEFAAVEDALAPRLRRLRDQGLTTEISPVFKTGEEAAHGSPLFLDMVEDARIVLDRDGFFAGILARLRGRLHELGARRVWRGARWYWDLKPDRRPGEVIEL